ncbi:MAG: phospholipid carrier-dependent glycosyltransferase [Candidatus Nitrohelix vancouverensis]|uniref:Phospholipid carrier-dependent glycosyltransferase n=1 Tax=Candidatus Nitrohelix vancouverensis TaxID=2705534 RepID=A0A7T0G2J0_9BACT|nr:MAG: phospholipid carrier-dependent glycosyltransferase [Candidatus Nitrohelix vancouverensis]
MPLNFIAPLILLLIFLATRTLFLDRLPIFNDEAIYIRWAVLIRDDLSNLFISAQDGKTPMFMWLNALTLKLFEDIVLSGRLVSALAAGVTAWLFYLAGRAAHSQRCGYIAAFLYLILPFFVLHDRLALADPLAVMLATALLAILTAWTLTGTMNPQRGALLGLVLGLGFLTKTPFLILFIFPLLAVFLSGKGWGKNVRLPLAVAYLVALCLMAPYQLHQPEQHVVGVDKTLHNANLIKPLIATLQFQNPHFLNNIREYGEYLWLYITPAVLALALAGGVAALRKKEALGILCLLWIALPAGAFIVLSGEVYSRYYLLSLPPLILLAARPLAELLDGERWQGRSLAFKSALAGFALLCLLPAARLDYAWIVDPRSAPLATKDRWQYTASEYAGYGVREAVQLMLKNRGDRALWLFTSRTWGMPGDALHLYLKDQPKVHLVELWWAHSMPMFPSNVEGMVINRSKYQLRHTRTMRWDETEGADVYFAARERFFAAERLLPGNPNLMLVKSYQTTDGKPSFNLFKRNDAIQVLITPKQEQKAGPGILLE